MRHFVVSQNLVKSNLHLPQDAILRINMAWHKDLDSVNKMCHEHEGHRIFLDIPIGRKKPPNHSHDLDDIAKIVNAHENIKYVAISNVEDAATIKHYAGRFNSKIVPKIETYKGVRNIAGIIKAMNYAPQVLMLDHENLFSNLVSLKKEKQYLAVVERLVKACRERGACLLRAKGIVFSDE